MLRKIICGPERFNNFDHRSADPGLVKGLIRRSDRVEMIEKLCPLKTEVLKTTVRRAFKK